MHNVVQRKCQPFRYNFRAKHQSELTVLRGELLEVERSVDLNWVEVRLGERRGMVPVDYLELQDEEARSAVTSSTPSTPERPKLAGVYTEELYKPTDLLKSKLREEFLERERKMLCLDKYITQTMEEFCPEDNELLKPRKCQQDNQENVCNPKNTSEGPHLQ